MSKFYVVFVGKKTGIFDNWDECKENVNGYKGALYKSYKDFNEANLALKDFNTDKNDIEIPESKNNENINLEITTAITIDGACSGNPGIGEYQGVKITGDLKNMKINTKENIIKSKKYLKTTNNIMEFLALMEAIKYIHSSKSFNIKILTDSITALAWVRNKKVKTSLEEEELNKEMFKEINENLDFLKNNDLTSIIIEKWETNKFGEIPADFGRK